MDLFLTAYPVLSLEGKLPESMSTSEATQREGPADLEEHVFLRGRGFVNPECLHIQGGQAAITEQADPRGHYTEIALGAPLHQSRDTETRNWGKDYSGHNWHDFRGSADLALVCTKSGPSRE